MNITRKTALALAVALPVLAGSASAQNNVQRNFYKTKINIKATAQDGIDDTEKVRINTNDVIEQLLLDLFGPLIAEDIRPNWCTIIAQIGNDEDVISEVQYWLVKDRGRGEDWRIKIPVELLDSGQAENGISVYKRQFSAQQSTVKILSTSSGDFVDMNLPAFSVLGTGLTETQVKGKDFALGEVAFLNQASARLRGQASVVLFPVNQPNNAGFVGIDAAASFDYTIAGSLRNDRVLELPEIDNDFAVILPIEL